MVTIGSVSSGPGGDRLPILVLHVQVDQVVPVPPVDRQNDQDEEIGGECERLRQASCGHKRARTRSMIILPRALKSTKARRRNRLLRLQHDSSRSARCSTRSSRSAMPTLRPRASCDALRVAPFEDLGFARVDTHRELRQGFPEVILGLGKTPAQIAAIAERIVARGQSLLVTRATTEALRCRAAGRSRRDVSRRGAGHHAAPGRDRRGHRHGA